MTATAYDGVAAITALTASQDEAVQAADAAGRLQRGTTRCRTPDSLTGSEAHWRCA